jgi:hypothetical protein
VDIRHHSVIYNVTDEIRRHDGPLDPTFGAEGIGSAVVRAAFKVPKVGTVAGYMVQDGRSPQRRRTPPPPRRRGRLGGQTRLSPAGSGRRVGGRNRLRCQHRPAELNDVSSAT